VFVYQTSSHSKKNNFYHDRSNRQYTTEIQKHVFSPMSSQQYSPVRRYKVQLHMENKQNPRNESNTITWYITHCHNSITDKLKNNNIQNFHHVTHLWELYNNIYIHTRARMHNLAEKLHLVFTYFIDATSSSTSTPSPYKFPNKITSKFILSYQKQRHF
jgi:hypothetical protein